MTQSVLNAQSVLNPQSELAKLLHEGTVIPAHPLALNADRTLDEVHQRALSRYYFDAGSGGIAVGVHSTQFEIRDHGMYSPILELAAETVDEWNTQNRPFLKVAGVAGTTENAVAEAEIAAELGYHAVLLSPPRPGPEDDLWGRPEEIERYALDRARAVGEVMPVIGFYLQEAIRGPRLSFDFWRQFVEIESVVAVKAAPFNRYRTLDVARAIAESSRRDEVTLYTGNDDTIVHDLLSDFTFDVDGDSVTVNIRGGLLGHWSVWTKRAVEMHQQTQRAREGDRGLLSDLMSKANAVTDANGALFDAVNNFAGCIPGVHEILRRQGLMQGRWCLNPEEVVSPGQVDELDRVIRSHPWLTDDEFVAEHLDEWLR